MRPEAAGRRSVARAGRAARGRRRVDVAFLVASLLLSLTAAAPSNVTLATGLNADGSTMWYVGPGTGTSVCGPTGVDFRTGPGYDSDYGAIQKAVDSASSGDSIYLCDHVYELTSGVVVAKDLSFQGQGQQTVAVSGGDAVRLFDATGHDIEFYTLTLRNGSTPGSGGAVTAANVTVAGVTLTENTAYGSGNGAGGGAIHATETVFAIGSTFTDNDAVNGDGGGIDASTGATIGYSTFARNNSGGTVNGTGGVYSGGGGVMVQTSSGYLRIVNSTFVANTAWRYGSAIYGPDIDITNGTIVGTASNKYMLSSWGNIGSKTYGVVTLTDTILAHGACDISTNLAKRRLIGTNLKSDTSSCPNAIDPVTPEALGLQPLADNGGPTWTVAITDGSAAHDATTGIAGDGVCATPYDQRGTTRPQGAACDIGAFELKTTLDLTVGPGGGTGPCESPGFRTGPAVDSDYGAIQKAVDAASSGDTILLCDHVYDLTTGIDVTAKAGLTFQGESTTGTEVSGGGSVRLFDALGQDVSFVGLTLRDGQAPAGEGGGAVRAANVGLAGTVLTGNEASGGGAILATGVVSATDATFDDNTSFEADGGGAIFATGAELVGGSFSGNSAVASIGGGAVLVWGGSVGIVGTSFVGNSALGVEGGGSGGAVLVIGPASVTDATFVGNLASSDFISGGGAIATLGPLDIFGGSFEENTAGSVGGAILAAGGVRTRDVLFVRNTSTGLGGGAVYLGGEATIIGSTFDHNSTAGFAGGGAIVSDWSATEGVVRVANSTFVSNSAPSGPGGAILANLVEVTNGTFVDNSASTGDHISASDGSGTGSLTAGDTIFSGGTCAIAATTVGLNLTTDASCPGDPTTGPDLDLGTLAENGGPTPTIGLGGESVAIDASPACLLGVDQRGEPRPAGAACDIGAFETFPPPASAITAQVSRDADGTDLTAGVPAITLGDTVTDVATVTGSASDGSGGFLEPTSGSVAFYYCYDASAAPTECTSGTWTAAGVDGMDGGADATDGIATATLEGWAPPGGWAVGWYLLSAVYDSSGGTYRGAQTTGDLVGSVVHYVRPSVAVVYNGPWRISSSTPLARVQVAATVLPEVAGCQVRFGVSGGDGALPLTLLDATTGANGVASVEVSGGSSGLYGLFDVSVAVLDATCTPASDPDAGTLAILPGSVSNGSVGGGWTRTDGTRASFAHTVSVTSATSKVRGSLVTTTTTKGSLIWKTNHWRLKAVIDQATTDGSSAWIRYPSCSSAYGVDVTVGDSGSGICGQVSGTGTLQEWSSGSGTWVPSSYGTVRFTVRLYDGGYAACKGRNCNNPQELADWYGIRMWSGPGYLSPLPLPLSYVPVPLAGSSGKGSISNEGTSCGTNGKKCQL